MKGPRVKPILRESKRAIEKINEMIQESEENDRIIAMPESDLKQLVVNVIANVLVELDSNYVRKKDLKRELELALQDMVKSNISPGGSK